MPKTGNKTSNVWTAKDVYDMLFKEYGNAHVNAGKARAKEAAKYTIPYIPEKEIMLTTGRYNTGKISTNLLDSIYNAAQRTGVPLDIALGLAGRESTLGIGRGFKKGKSISGTDLYSNWQQIQSPPNNKAQINKWNNLLNKDNLSDEDYDFKSDFIIRAQNVLENTKPLSENPIDNALKFYMTGKYNPGDKRHTQMVEEEARILMTDPAIQKWYKEKTNKQMKCGGRRKAQLGLDIREGGIAIPINKNMYYMQGRSHDEGGIGIGPNNKNGLEVEGGEVVKVDNNSIKVFSSVPLLRGVSPAQLVMGGANPNKVFRAQEDFKDRNHINDDGTKYETGGENKTYTPPFLIRNQIARTGRITYGGYPIGISGKGYKGLRALSRFRKTLKESYNIPKAIDSAVKGFIYDTNNVPNGGSNNKAMFIKHIYNRLFGKMGEHRGITMEETERRELKSGGIYIKPSKRGTFTAAAKKRGMGVQEFASKVLANKENYSSAMVKKANFARNASRWKKKYGGSMIYEINGNVKNGLMSLRPKAQFGKEKKINSTTKIGADGLIYTWGPDGEWYTDGTRYEDSKYYMREKSVLSGGKRSDGSVVKPKQKTQSLDEIVVSAPKINKQEKPISEKEIVNNKKTINSNKSNKDNKDISNSRPQYYAKKRLPIAGSKSIAEKAGLARSGWSYADGSYTINGLNYNIPSITEPKSSTPRRGSNKASDSTTKAAKTTTNNSRLYEDAPIGKITHNRPNLYIEGLKNKAIDVTPINAALVKGIDMSNIDSSSTGGQTQARLIGQFKPTSVGDWIGLGTNVIGSLASYFINKDLINKLPMPQKPVMAPAAKLKTRYNVEPQLTESREAELSDIAAVERNVASSNVAAARRQRISNRARQERAGYYGQKENIETQLINQDRLNRQSVIGRNVATYNDWLSRVANMKLTQSSMRSSNINNLISGLAGGVGDMLSRIESRRATNNTLRAISAANPNVDARLIGGFDYYTDMYGRRYDKNGKLIKR